MGLIVFQGYATAAAVCLSLSVFWQNKLKKVLKGFHYICSKCSQLAKNRSLNVADVWDFGGTSTFDLPKMEGKRFKLTRTCSPITSNFICEVTVCSPALACSSTRCGFFRSRVFLPRLCCQLVVSLSHQCSDMSPEPSLEIT